MNEYILIVILLACALVGIATATFRALVLFPFTVRRDGWKKGLSSYWASIAFGAPCVAFIVATAGAAGLNHAGVCLPQMRMLTDEEKIYAAAGRANARTAVYITSMNQMNGYTHYETTMYTAVPYKNTAAFLANNPDCCRITMGWGERLGESPPPPGVAARFLGAYLADVNINYTAHYIDSDGKPQSAPYKAIITLGNCGHETRP